MKTSYAFAALLITVVVLDSCTRSSSTATNINGLCAGNSCGSSATGDSGDEVTMLQVSLEPKSRSDTAKVRRLAVEHVTEEERGWKLAKESGKLDLVQEHAAHVTDHSGKAQERPLRRQHAHPLPGSRQARQNERRRTRKTRPVTLPPLNWVQDWSADPKLKDYTAVLDYIFYQSMSTQRGGDTKLGIVQVLLCCCIILGMCALCWMTLGTLPSAGAISSMAQSQETPSLKFILHCSSFCACFWGMTVVNKSLASATKTPTILAAAQMLMTVLGISLLRRDKLVGNRESVAKWLLVPMLSSGMLVCSFFTYKYFSIATLTIIRNLGPLLAMPIESVVMPLEKRPHVNGQTISALLVGLISVFMSCKTISASLEGTGFALLILVLGITERLVQRRLLTTECEALSTESCVMLNNCLGMFPTLIIGACLGEFEKVDMKVWFGSVTTVLLVVSGVIGSFSCYLALAVQRQIHTTSFMVLENGVRTAAVLLSVLVFFDPIGWPFQVHGLFFSIGGTIWYAKSQFAGSEARKRCQAVPKEGAAALFHAAVR